MPLFRLHVLNSLCRRCPLSRCQRASLPPHVLLPPQSESPVVVPSLADEKKMYYEVAIHTILTFATAPQNTLHFDQNLIETAEVVPVDNQVNILTYVTQLHSARAQVAAQIAAASPSASDYAWLYQVRCAPFPQVIILTVAAAASAPLQDTRLLRQNSVCEFVCENTSTHWHANVMHART
jgi:hypothetical protein